MNAPPAGKLALIEEALAIAAPDFEYQDAVWEESRRDETHGWLYADAAYVRATHPSSDRVSAAVEFWLQSDAMIAEDTGFKSRGDEKLTTIEGGGRELLYRSQWGKGFTLATAEEVGLWQRLGIDWPDCVVVCGLPDAVGAGTFAVELTRWDVYAATSDYPFVRATYAWVNGEWVLTDWEYVSASLEEALLSG